MSPLNTCSLRVIIVNKKTRNSSSMQHRLKIQNTLTKRRKTYSSLIKVRPVSLPSGITSKLILNSQHKIQVLQARQNEQKVIKNGDEVKKKNLRHLLFEENIFIYIQITSNTRAQTQTVLQQIKNSNTVIYLNINTTVSAVRTTSNVCFQTQYL